MKSTVPMLFRREMRIAVITALQKAQLWVDEMPVTIDSPGNWSLQHLQNEDALPCILIRTSNENKASSIRAGQPQFNTSVSIDVMCVVSSTTAENAQDDIEQVWFQIENILLSDSSIINRVQNVNSVDSKLEIDSSGNDHIAAMSAAFVYEGFEVYDGIKDVVNLDNVGIHVDLTNVYDPTGIYPDAQFPQSVSDAPRTHGPDGRDEAVIDIQLRE